MRLLACHVIPTDGTRVGIEWGRPSFRRKAWRITKFVLKVLFYWLAVLTSCIWGPFVALYWLRKPILILLTIGLLGASGCTNVSNRMDKSPCACEFKPANTGNVQGDQDA